MRERRRTGREWHAERYDEERFGGAFGRYLRDHEIAVFLSMVEGAHGWVLDVGAGTGKLSLPLMRHSRQVISLDVSPEMLRFARESADQEGLDLTPVVCDVHDLCFGNETFECVVASRLLMHLADWRKAIAELCRVTRGAIVVDFTPWRSLAGVTSLFMQCWSFFRADIDLPKVFLIRRVTRELRRQSFRLVMLKRSFFLPMTFHRWLDRPMLSVKMEGLCRRLGLVQCFGAPVSLLAIRERPGDPEMRQQRSLS